MEIGHGASRPASIQEPRLQPLTAHALEHRDQRSHPDATGDKEVCRGRLQLEGVPREADSENITLPNLAMEIRRAPAALRLEEHRYYVPGPISGVSTQGVLSRQSTRDVDVDVRAGLPFRKVVAASVDQVEDAYAITRVAGSVDLELQ